MQGWLHTSDLRHALVDRAAASCAQSGWLCTKWLRCSSLWAEWVDGMGRCLPIQDVNRHDGIRNAWDGTELELEPWALLFTLTRCLKPQALSGEHGMEACRPTHVHSMVQPAAPPWPVPPSAGIPSCASIDSSTILAFSTSGGRA